MNIFACTTICSPRLFGVGSSRCWAFFHNYDKAEEYIFGNYGDLHECDNDYAVIEETEEGPFYAINEWWFKWNNLIEKYERCGKPDFSNGVLNWGAG